LFLKQGFKNSIFVVSFFSIFFGYLIFYVFLILIFCNLKKGYLSLFFLTGFLFSLLLNFSILFLGFLILIILFISVLYVWEPVKPSLVCWAITQTKTHATSEWVHL